MSLRTEATIDDLYRADGKAELVGGEIVMMPPTGGLPGYAGGEIQASLRAYARRTRRGYAIGDNVGFVVELPNRKSFSPDVAFHIGKLRMKFVDGPPVFAAEIRTENDYGPAAEREMAAKRSDYFAAGTQVVWDVDLQNPDVVRVYRAGDPDRPTNYVRGQIAEAEPAVPGWTMPVDELFEPDQS